MRIYLFDKPTDKQIRYAIHLKSFLRVDKPTSEEIDQMSKKEISVYIDEIKPYAEEIIEELSSHMDMVW
ncbi:TPA: hypothetical protein ACH968_001625 [Staphylococcus aureus]